MGLKLLHVCWIECGPVPPSLCPYKKLNTNSSPRSLFIMNLYTTFIFYIPLFNHKINREVYKQNQIIKWIPSTKRLISEKMQKKCQEKAIRKYEVLG